jgi:hypothetical protein
LTVVVDDGACAVGARVDALAEAVAGGGAGSMTDAGGGACVATNDETASTGAVARAPGDGGRKTRKTTPTRPAHPSTAAPAISDRGRRDGAGGAGRTIDSPENWVDR